MTVTAGQHQPDDFFSASALGNSEAHVGFGMRKEGERKNVPPLGIIPFRFTLQGIRNLHDDGEIILMVFMGPCYTFTKARAFPCRIETPFSSADGHLFSPCKI